MPQETRAFVDAFSFSEKVTTLMMSDNNSNDSANEAAVVEVDAVAEVDAESASAPKKYGKTGSAKLLFQKYFKVVGDKAGSLDGKCLDSKCCNNKPHSVTEFAFSNLTRHLVRNKINFQSLKVKYFSK